MTTFTKTAQRKINAQIRSLRSERKNWLAGRYLHWGQSWCAGPGSPYHEEPCCEGCATVLWCRDRATPLAEEIRRLQALLVSPVRGALW